METIINKTKNGSVINRITSYNVCYTKLLRPTPGGNKVVNKSFINYVEGNTGRAY